MPRKRISSQTLSTPQFPRELHGLVVQPAGQQFLSPWLKEVTAILRTDKRAGQETITLPLEGKIQDVAPFLLANGDTTVLNQLIRENPHLYQHPILWHYIFQISHFIRHAQVDEWRIEEAQGILLRILESWIEGMVPGARITPPPKRKGRKLSPQQEQFQDWIYDEYCELLQKLQHFKIGLEGQSPDKQHARLKKAILTVYDRWIEPSPNTPTTPPPPSGPWPVMPDPYRPPSSEAIDRWLRNKKVNLGKDAFRDYLVFCLLGHQHHKTPDSIRGLVQRQRQKWQPIKPPTIQS